MKNILMVAFHYPPVIGSSGVHRTLSFSRYLPELGFRPIVLTAQESTYSAIDNSLLEDIPKEVIVVRAKAFDISRDFPIDGYYPLILALPDRWQSWIFSGVLKGMSLIRNYQPRAIWSTYPIASAHLIALILHKKTKLPWIADFRDPMAQPNYPKNKIVWHSYNWIEKETVENASVCVFVTPGAKKDYMNRYGLKYDRKFVVIENGIDERIFKQVKRPSDNKSFKSKPFKLIHSGLLYQKERNPDKFFKAVRSLKNTGTINASKVKVLLRASGNELLYEKKIHNLKISDIIEFAQSIPYKEALVEMLSADGLLLFQGSSCNNQVPAKVYEYLRTGIPIIGLVDTGGDTHRLLKKAGHSYLSDLNSVDAITECLKNFLHDLENNLIQTEGFIMDQFDRKARAKELSTILLGLINSRLHEIDCFKTL